MDLRDATVAVTGATGFLGSYLTRGLLAAGATVRGVVRSPDKAPFLWDEGAQPVRADLADSGSLVDAFRGADVVVANAALFSMSQLTARHWEANFQANLGGTENVMRAAAAAGVSRVIHISTFGVYRWSLRRRLREDSPQLDGEKREGGAYRATKQLSERLAWSLADELGLSLTTLRPSSIYGARDSNTTQVVARILHHGRWLPFIPTPWFCLPLVYAGDVANACVAAVERPESAGEAYNVGGTDESLFSFVRTWMRIGGLTLPVAVPLPVPIKLGFRIDNSKAERDLGFTNRSFEDGLRETFDQEPDLLRGCRYEHDVARGRA